MGERELPEGWECVKIGDIATHVSSGSTPRGGEEVYDKEGILFIRSQNIHMNKIIFENIAHISDEIHQSMPRSWVKKGDVLFNITGASIGRVAYFNGEDNSANVNQHVCIIRTDKKKVIPEFLSYQLSRPSYQCKILSNQSGATRQAFNYTQIKNFEIPLPPLHIQHQIVAVLEQAETVKRQRQEADVLTGTLLQSVFYEMFGDPVRNEKGWEKAKLKEVTLWHKQGIYTNMSYVENGTKLIRVTDILEDGTLDYPNMPFLNLDSKTIDQFKAKVGDFIFARSGSIGRCAIVKETIPAVFGSFSICFRFNPKKVNNNFFLYFMKIPSVLSRFKKFSHGSANININAENIKDLDIFLPPLALQQQFARVVQDVERIRKQQGVSGKEIEGLFEGLMAGAFAGELVAL
jgi:type I restriction enzyme S subunit